MSKAVLFLCVFFSLTALMPFAQDVGDQAAAGFSEKRTYLNSDMGNLQPPLMLNRTLDLAGVQSADNLSLFEDMLLIAEGVEDWVQR